MSEGGNVNNNKSIIIVFGLSLDYNKLSEMLFNSRILIKYLKL